MFKYSKNYKQYLRRGFNSRKEAELAEAKDRLNPNLSISFSSLLEAFCSQKKQEVKITTFVAIQRIINKYIEPFFKDIKVNRLDVFLISKWRINIDKLKLTIKYKNQILSVLKSLFDYMNSNGFPNSFNFNLVSFRDDIIKINKSKKRYISVEEFNKFYSVIDNDKYKILFKLAFLTGCRISEIRGLSVNAVKDGGVYIYQTANSRLSNGKTNIITPKSSTSNRFIPLHEEFYNDLLEYINSNNLAQDDFVFCGYSKDYPIGEMTINRFRQIYIKKSGVKYFIFHDFRHSVASVLAESGENLNNVAMFLGQSSKVVTEKYYLIQRDETKIKIAKSLYNRINNKK